MTLRFIPVGFLLAVAILLFGAQPAAAAVSCPSPIPVVHENNCMGAGTTAWKLTNYSDTIGGFSTRTSVNRGEDVVLKIGRNNLAPSTTYADVSVYRIGYYGAKGGRLISAASSNGVVVNNTHSCNPRDTVTGLLDCGNWSPTYTIPGGSLPASGIYVAKITATDTGQQNSVVFAVRDDNRNPESDLLFQLPTSTYQAYNNWGGKSLYYDKTGGGTTIAGTGRAVKVSFNRPIDRATSTKNRFVGADYYLVYWLERQGYDVSYTDSVRAHVDPAELLQHDALVVSGHDEYWSGEQFAAFKAARDAGVSIASFSSNSAYWKVRYENGERTLVTFKTVQGSGSSGNGRATPNDFGPDGVTGTADDALGADGRAGTADDNPQNSTTTFRDNGAPPGDPNAPAAGRVGPNTPENGLFGVMYVGDNDSTSYPLTVPPANAANEFAGDRTWRNSGVSTTTSTSIGTRIVHWEWDAIPTQSQYLAHQPPGVVRVTGTDTNAANSNWIQDEGRVYAQTPPPGQSTTVTAVRYTAASGAKVFATGTNQWSYGLSSTADSRIWQATYNVFSDMGPQPFTPTGITLDGSPPVNQAPSASFTAAPNPAQIGQTVTFDGSASSDPDGQITRYEWDLDGNGSFETDRGSNPSVTSSYAAAGAVAVQLRVTDNGGSTSVATRTLNVAAASNQSPSASFTATPNPAQTGVTVTFDGSASSDPDGQVARYEWDLDGNGCFETDTGVTPTASRSYASAGQLDAGLRVTDNGGAQNSTTRAIAVNGSGASYAEKVLAVPSLISYWRMSESAGGVFADSKANNDASVSGATMGVTGALAGDTNAAASYDGADDFASAPLNLSAHSSVTVEFWLKWDAFANNDDLALEFTSNFNNVAGGFLVNPNAVQGSKFGVAISKGTSRNNVYFTRPSAGVWHHYAFVLNTTAAGVSVITPYVDGVAVPYTKANSGTGAGNFANSNLYFMARAGQSLFGAGDLDELAVFGSALGAATIADHYQTGTQP